MYDLPLKYGLDVRAIAVEGFVLISCLIMEGLFGKYRVLLAPMAGVTDIAMRALCREQGADMTFTEMVSAKGLSYANEKTRHLLDLADGEDQVAVQVFGHEPETIAAQAAWIEETLADALSFIDINMGCPVRKIAGKGDGSALMKDPELAASIVAATSRAVEHPVTCKFRRGWAAGEFERAAGIPPEQLRPAQIDSLRRKKMMKLSSMALTRRGLDFWNDAALELL